LTNIAPINEVLAAGIIMLSDWDQRTDFLDPMCGSGTFLIEAAMMASKIPANINRNVLRLISSVDRSKDGSEDLIDNYNPRALSETLPGSKYTSYSVNKGEKISICIRKEKDNTFIDDNTVLFVVIHELAHVMTKEVGHTPKFWDNMAYLLEQGEKIGIYIPEDYGENPVDYCGMEINSTPYKKFN